jgi:large subunit ribosomal protein L17
VADRLITLGKNGSVHARRQALSVVRDREVVHKLFAEVAPRYTERMGGYTRILKLGVRKGDAAPMALIEWVEGEAVAVVSEPEARRRLAGRLRRRGKEAEADRPARSARRKAGSKEAPAGLAEGGEPGEDEGGSAATQAPPAARAEPAEEAAAEPAGAGEAGEAGAGAVSEPDEAPAGEQEPQEE